MQHSKFCCIVCQLPHVPCLRQASPDKVLQQGFLRHMSSIADGTGGHQFRHCSGSVQNSATCSRFSPGVLNGRAGSAASAGAPLSSTSAASWNRPSMLRM